MTTAKSIIFVAFSVVNACRLLAYLPQISVIIKNRDATAVSSATWLLFFLSNGVTWDLNAARVTADMRCAVTFLANTICCGTIVMLVLQAEEVSSSHIAFRISGQPHLALDDYAAARSIRRQKQDALIGTSARACASSSRCRISVVSVFSPRRTRHSCSPCSDQRLSGCRPARFSLPSRPGIDPSQQGQIS